MTINADVAEMVFGNLRWKDGIPYIKIVNNLYEGQFVNLEKPLLLLDKTTARTSSEDGRSKCEIEAIIERKLLFNIRPRAIITQTNITGLQK